MPLGSAASLADSFARADLANLQHGSNTSMAAEHAAAAFVTKTGAPAIKDSPASTRRFAGTANDFKGFNVTASTLIKPVVALQTRQATGPFAHVVLLLMFNSANYISNIASLERWYSPHFGRIVIYCDIPGSDTPEQAAAAALARGVPQELVEKVIFIHSGVGIFHKGGVTRSDIAGGSFSQVALAHYYAQLRNEGELESEVGPNAIEGVFFLCDDALLNTQLLGSINVAHPLLGPAYESGRLIDSVGRGRDHMWSWWQMEEGIPRMRTAMADPAMIEFAPTGDPSKIEWVGAYSDYVFIPRKFLVDGRLQRCLALLASLVVFNEIAIPTCVHLCVMPVPDAELVYQPHGRTILWGEERKVINLAFIENKLRTDLIIHPVKLGRLIAADRQRLDAAMLKRLL
jgi:hypothetical protein